jgi:hypothetical protein
MASATALATLRSRVRFRVGNKTSINDRIDDNLNKAVLHFVLEARPQEAVTSSTATTTSSGTAAYNLASDVLAIMAVRDTTNDREILNGSLEHYNSFKQDTSDSSTLGKPRRWVRIANQIIFYQKIPDGAYATKYWYLQRPTTMDSSNGFPLNLEHEEPVVELATAFTWRDLNAQDKAQLHFSAYREMVAAREEPEEIEDEAPEGGFLYTSNIYRGYN